MMIRLTMLALRLAAMAAVLFVGPSFAGDVLKPKAVIEMFTSQGCNSCPPADEVLAELAKRKDLVALGYHVDYWDYLGWKDTLATAANTSRQKSYGKTFAKRSVYTPQAVINGRIHVNGAKREAVKAAIRELEKTGRGMSIDISVTQSGQSMLIDAAGAPNGKGDAHLVLVYFDPARPVTIERGANKGRTIAYANPVTEVHTAGMWHGKPARFELPKSEMNRKGGCAILLQAFSKDGLPGAILGAAIVPPEIKAR